MGDDEDKEHQGRSDKPGFWRQIKPEPLSVYSLRNVVSVHWLGNVVSVHSLGSVALRTPL
jgi:hypothetical protein